jgi:hypothetical protein
MKRKNISKSKKLKLKLFTYNSEDLAHFLKNKDRRTKEQIHYEKERDQRLIHENVETYNEVFVILFGIF